ncbi:hypothetical protein BASA81_001169 [Batrachochytrium salamandrivorans]|nr:hypothetical protein BASA81_001169 [Batrachochytrium salamandrivorans]
METDKEKQALPPNPPPPSNDGPYEYPPQATLKNSLSGWCPELCCYRRKIGRFYVLHQTAEGEPICMLGPCWPMFFVTFLLIAGPSALVIGGLGRNYIEVVTIGSVLAFVTLVGFVSTACRNPGIVPRRQVQLGNDELYDERALSYRPYGSIYDYETGTLIRGVDHFCPWTK